MHTLLIPELFSCVRRANLWVVVFAATGLAVALPLSSSGADKLDQPKRPALKPLGDAVGGTDDPVPPRTGPAPVRVFVSPDAKLVCVRSKDSKAFLWDTTKQAKACDLTAAQDVSDFCGGSKWLLVNALGGMRLLDATTGKQASEPLPILASTGFRALSADGTTLARYDTNKKVVQVWETLTAKPLCEPIPMPTALSPFFSSHQPLIPSLTMAGHATDNLLLSPDGKLLLTQNAVKAGSVEVDVYLWEAATGKQIAKLAVPKNKPPANLNYLCCFSPDGKTLATLGGSVRNERGGFQPTAITFFDAATGQATGSPIKVESNTWMTIFLYAPDGKSILTQRQLDEGGTELVLYDIETGKATRRFALAVEATGTTKLQVHYGANVATFTPDGKTLITGSDHVRDRGARGSGVAGPLPGEAKDGYAHCVLVWDVETGKPLAAPEYCKHRVVQLVVAPDGRSFWTATGPMPSGVIGGVELGQFEAQQWQLPERPKSPGESEKDKTK